MAGRRPLVAVVSCSRLIDGRAHQAIADRFLTPLAEIADVDCVIVPAMPGLTNARSLASSIDALLLTGSCSNIEPRRYGSDRTQDGRADPDRDRAAIALAAAMVDAERPVFGICRGLQEINVLFGGTLDDDVASSRSPIHRSATVSAHPGSYALYEAALGCVSHGVAVIDGAMGQARDLHVVSAHGQGIATLGCGLVAEAHAPDGLVEAVSWKDRLLAVQWHPEIAIDRDPESVAFYQAIGHAGRWGRIGFALN